MNTASPEAKTTSARRALIPFALAMLAANIGLHIVIALTGNTVGLLTYFGVALIALGYAVFILVYGKHLKRVRFGSLAAHTMTYASVSSGFLLHFFILAVTANPVLDGESAHFVTAPTWFGVALAMPALWGIGLTLHALGAILSRGFEN